MTSIFASHEPRTFVYASDASDDSSTAPIEQTVLGWSQGGCDIVWSDVLPRVVAAHGAAICSNKSVLELGAGCGLIGLLAARWAARVDITDGDQEEVDLIARNVAEHAPAGGGACAAHFLEWGEPAAREASAGAGALLPSYDLILASQVVYVEKAIAPLVETMATLLAPGGCVLLYNDAVSTLTTQPRCRALLSEALTARGLCAVPCELRLPSGVALPHEHAYLLRISRASDAV